MTRIEAGGVAFEVEAVAFDKDGTLIDLDAAWGPSARRWVETAATGDAALAEALSGTLGFEVETGRLLPGGVFASGTVSQLVEATRGVLHRHGLDRTRARVIAEEARRQSALAADQGRLVPIGDVSGTISAMHEAGLRIAIVSSDDMNIIEDTILALGISDRIEVIVAGSEGFPPKPAPDSLLMATRRLGVDPARTLYVGDSRIDAEAGKAAGLAGTVLVGTPPPDAVEVAAAVVPSVDELVVTWGT